MFKSIDQQVDEFFKSCDRIISIEKQKEQELDNEIEEAWQEHLDSYHWGSGEDRIKITEEMFHEFKDNYLEEKYNQSQEEAFRSHWEG